MRSGPQPGHGSCLRCMTLDRGMPLRRTKLQTTVNSVGQCLLIGEFSITIPFEANHGGTWPCVSDVRNQILCGEATWQRSC